jgi:hypothetical protein
VLSGHRGHCQPGSPGGQGFPLPSGLFRKAANLLVILERHGKQMKPDSSRKMIGIHDVRCFREIHEMFFQRPAPAQTVSIFRTDGRQDLPSPPGRVFQPMNFRPPL